MAQTADFTRGKIAGPLIRFTIPMLLAMLLQSLYGAVDLMIVGQFGSPADVSAVATGTQIMMFVTVVFIGLAAGMTILLGQSIGAGKKEEAGKIVGSGIMLFIVMAAAMTILMMFLTDPFTRVMQAPKEAFFKTTQYVRICSGGIAFIVAYNVLGSIFRGIGDSKTPLLAVALATVFNIAGDLLLVAVFHMAAAGAALATVLAQGISVLLCLLIIRKRGLPFSFHKSDLKLDRFEVGRIFRVGMPIALQDGLVSISFLVIASIVNSLGLIASAGVGVAERLCGFIMLVPSAFSQALSAFVAQNIGAGKEDRAIRSMLVAMAASFVIDALMAYAAFFHGDILSSLFSKDEAVIQASWQYLKAYSIDTLLVTFLFSFIGYFNGCGRTFFCMIQGLIGAFLVRIPVSFLASREAVPSLFHIGLATPASTAVQIVLCCLFFIVMFYKKKKA